MTQCVFRVKACLQIFALCHCGDAQLLPPFFVMRLIPTLLSAALFAASSLAASALSIEINAAPGLAENAAALAAFQRAADLWAVHFSDPITIHIDANLATLAPNTIGSTSSVFLFGGFNEIRDQLVADAAGQADKSILLSLPRFSQFSATLPAGRSVDDSMEATKANLKAMGFTGLDEAFGVSDATITFNSSFAFDYDNRNGVGAGLMDFETVACHEIGHALGFISAVDDIDSSTSAGYPMITLAPLDLFRFRAGAAPDTAHFQLAARDLSPGANDVLGDGVAQWAMSTGYVNGDGFQASHWKADDLTGNYIGVMDPTLNYGDIETPTNADLRALSLIGYDTVPPSAQIPEAGAGWLLGLGAGVCMLTAWRRRR